MKLLAIIPARHSSQRLPDKNYRMFYGKPIITWPLEEARKTELFEQIIISTDKRIDWLNPEHKTIKQHMRRNNEYERTVDDVCKEVLEQYKDYDYVCVIYPTAYAVTWKDICNSFKKMIENNKDFCFSNDMINGSKQLDNGGFYWFKTEAFLNENTVMGENQINFEMPMVDINTLFDWCDAKLHALTIECGRYK